MSDDALAEVRAALARGEKIVAIKLYRERTGVGLKEAKDAVERMEAEQPIPMAMEVPDRLILSVDNLARVKSLVTSGNKIAAIKVYRECTGLGLKEAKDAVDLLESQLEAAPRSIRAEDLESVREMARAGRKIEAIKLYREHTGLGLKEAKDAVERMSQEPAGVTAPAPAPSPITEADLGPIRALALSGQKIEAIKLYRQRTGLGLKESKDAVDALAPDPPPAMAEPTASPPRASEASGDLTPRPLRGDERARVRELVRAGNLPEALREYRELTGEGLKESKEAIDEMARAVPADANQRVGKPVKGCLGALLGLLLPL